jgi:hypothetical protein
VNWHEVTQAWAERRRMRRGLVQPEDTAGLAKKRLDDTTTKLGLPPVKGKRPGNVNQGNATKAAGLSAAAAGALALRTEMRQQAPKAATLELTADGGVKLRRELPPLASAGVLAAIGARAARSGAARQLPPLALLAPGQIEGGV